MFRHELKYIVNNASAHIIKNRLNKICNSDRNADKNGEYRVTSLYFDDFCNSAVEANLSGEYARKKFRIRIYNGSDAFIRLERKSKLNNACKKDAAILSKEQYQHILAGDYSFLQNTQNPVLRDFYLTVTTRLLRPKVIVDYVREAYVYEPGQVRITLDKYVKSSVSNIDLFDSNTVFTPAINASNIIMEVKYTGFLPRHIADMVQQSYGIRQSASKYTMCRLCAQ